MPSKIQWTDETWNPVTGCTPISEGCDNCYAKRMSQRLKGRYGYPVDDPFKAGNWRGDIVSGSGDNVIYEPVHWKKPRRVFVSSMGDLFHDDVKFNHIHQIWDVMKGCPQHTFMVLTKRPERMKQVVERIYSLERMGWSRGFWQHVWLGITAENQEQYDKRWPILAQIPAAVHFVSVEPMLGPMDMKFCLSRGGSPAGPQEIDWVIAGCETGPKRRPMIGQWVEGLKNQCVSENVPFFLKQGFSDITGKLVKMPYLDGRGWAQYPSKG